MNMNHSQRRLYADIRRRVWATRRVSYPPPSQSSPPSRPRSYHLGRPHSWLSPWGGYRESPYPVGGQRCDLSSQATPPSPTYGRLGPVFPSGRSLPAPCSPRWVNLLATDLADKVCGHST